VTSMDEPTARQRCPAVQGIEVLQEKWVLHIVHALLTGPKGFNAIGREVADKSGRPVIVAGSMGPTGEIMAPLGPLTHALAVEMFHEQAEGLKEGGVDVLWVETISAAEEYRAAAEGCARAGVPWCGTMSFDTAGRARRPAAGVRRELRRRRVRPAAHGAGIRCRRRQSATDRQGQRGHPEIRSRPYPL